MRTVLLLGMMLLVSAGNAQTPKVHALPEYVYIPPAPEKYIWERVMQVKHRTLFDNTIACTDSMIYSFGGFDTHLAQREMNRLEGGRLQKDTLRYPGDGYYDNLFFIRDSLMFIGGGKDSSMSQYAFNDFWQYDLHTHTWKRLKDLPFYYIHPPTVFTEDKRVIVLIPRLQGRALMETVPLFYEYSPVGDNWIPISKELPVPSLLHPVAFRIGADIFVLFQSRWNFGNPTNTFYKFSVKDGQWTELPSFPGRTKVFAFALSDGIYGYIGGGAGVLNSSSKEVFRYDPEQGKWTQISNLPRGVRHAIGWRYKDESYVGFGINDRDNTIAVWKLKQRK